MQRVAIMQGRLVPPQDGRFQCFPRRWREEFAHAAAAELDAIEWIYDLQGAEMNPLASDAGIAEMKSLSRESGVEVVSCCADFFMNRPFVKALAAEFAELTGHLLWLLNRCQMAGIRRVVMPFLDASRIYTAEQEERVVGMLAGVLPKAERYGVKLHLEMAHGPAEYAALLNRLPHPMLMVNYDSGNSASLGHNMRDEFAAYGPRIGSVHIKDRVRGGSTVPLGTGDADIPGMLEALVELRYAGDFVMEVARGEPGRETELARMNRGFLMNARSVACGSLR